MGTCRDYAPRASGLAKSPATTRSQVTGTKVVMGLSWAALPCHFNHTRVISDAIAIEIQVWLPGLLYSGIRSH